MSESPSGAAPEARPRRRRRRWIIAGVMAFGVLLGAAYAGVRIWLEGPPLADKVASILNKRMRGRIEIGSIEWAPSALKTAVTGGWIPVTVRDVKVWDDCALADTNADPEVLRTRDPDQDCTPDDKPDPDPTSTRRPRKLLLRSSLITGEIDAHAALFGNHDFVLRRVVLHGGEVLIEQTREPQPLHAYNKTIVSIVSAFYPRLKAGFRAGIYADKPPPVFDIRDVHLEHVNVTANVAPSANSDGTIEFGLAARIEDVNVDPLPEDGWKRDAYFYMDARDPLVQKFYVRLGVTGKHGYLRILDDGPSAAFAIDSWGQNRSAKYELEVDRIEMPRLAQLPTEWAHFDKANGYDYVANSLYLEASMHTIPCKTEGGPPPDPSQGANIHIYGGLESYWDRPYDGKWDFTLDAQNLGPTVRTCIKQTVGGDKMGGQIKISGPFIALPKVELDMHDVDIDIPLSKKEEPIQLAVPELHGTIDLVNDEGTIDKSKARERVGKDPGEVLLSAQFGLKPYHATASVDILKPIDVGRFLPVKAATSVGRYLVGKLSVDGDIETGFQIYDFDLGLGARPGDRVVKLRVSEAEKGRVFATNYFDNISLEHLHINAGKTNAVVNGKVNYVNDDWDYAIRIVGEYPDLGEWLKRFGLPPIAQSAGGGEVIITGHGNKPIISVNTVLTGVPCLDKVQASSTTEGGVTHFKIASGGLGGDLRGDGVLDSNGAVPKLDKLHLTGTSLEAARVCGANGVVAGTIERAELELHGTIDKNRSIPDWAGLAKVYASIPHATVMGDTYSNVSVCVNRSDDDDVHKCGRDPNIATAVLSECDEAKQRGGACAVVKAQRDRGGQLSAVVANVPAQKGRVVAKARLGGQIALDDLPMTILEPWVGPGKLGGLLATVLHLQGTIDAPQASGQIAWLRGWVGDAFVSDPLFSVTPTTLGGGAPGVLVQGSALSGALGIAATIGTRAPYPVDVVITGRRVEIDQFMDLSKKLGFSEPVQAWASGTLTLHTELAPASGKPNPVAWIEITELAAVVDHTSRDGRHIPLRFEVEAPDAGSLAMSLRVTPETIALACRDATAPTGSKPCPARLVTPAGPLAITGSATAVSMNIVATGDLRLEKLSALLENQLDAISGTLHLDANVSGTFDKPSYDATLSVSDALAIRPTGADTDLVVAKDGQVRILNGVLGFNSFTVSVAGERTGAPAELHVKGTIALAGWQPAQWGVLIDGAISGKLLQIVAPGAVAQASGVARIDGDIVLNGKGVLPLVSGTFAFEPEKNQVPLSILPRALRREIALTKGSIDIDTEDTGGHRTYTVEVGTDDPITATIDGEGRLQHVHGRASFRDGVPERAVIDLDADNVPFRNTDRTIELRFAANDVELAYESDRWIAQGVPGSEGTITVINGAYSRNFDLAEAIKPVPPTVAPAKPFWDEYPSIGNAEIDLKLVVQRFSVDNNIAKLDFSGHIDISGSPRDPRLAGSIGVNGRGDFKIPLTRAAFSSTRGAIDFSANERAANPKLELTSEANYQDLSGQQHVISLAITGTLEQPLWDLKTNTGLDKSQTLALLFLGRSPEQLRRSLGDSSIGVVDPTRGETSTNPSAGVADQVVKDLAGDWVSSLLGNSLTNITKLDVLRLELGFGSVGVHAEKKVIESIRVLGDAEDTVRGYTVKLTGVMRTPYAPFTLQGAWLDKTYSDPADQAQNINDIQGKIVYRLFIP